MVEPNGVVAIGVRKNHSGAVGPRFLENRRGGRGELRASVGVSRPVDP